MNGISHRSVCLILSVFFALLGPSGVPVARAQSTADEIQRRLNKLEAEIVKGEDVSAILRLQRAYGYYVDKGMWEDLADLFAEDAVGNYPNGVYIGKDSIRKHFFMNVGGGKVGDIGLGDNRLYNHMNLQPVIHIGPDGRTAKGRWRAMAMLGRYGERSFASWADGVYEITYIKDRGVWKIQKLDYHSGFGASFATGWIVPEKRTASRASRTLAHPADKQRQMACEGFPEACIAPFHYDNPGTKTGGPIWTNSDAPSSKDEPVSGGTIDIQQRVNNLARRAMMLHDEQEIENLQRIYGYYFDRRMWDQVADLFAEGGTIEIGLRGVYAGRDRIRKSLDLLGPEGLRNGQLDDHIQLQQIVSVAPDGQTARARAREFSMAGAYEGRGTWSEGIYENTYVKENGVWEIKSLHFFPTFITDYDKGWGKDARPAPTASSEFPPDGKPTETYEIYPNFHIPAFHYRNPVTGNYPQYPKGEGRPTDEAIQAAMAPVKSGGGKAMVSEIKENTDAILAKAERQIQRVKDYYEIQNLENAYGYYLDKNLWNDIADLFAEDASMELAQRGVYIGRERVRGFLTNVFGKEGPVEGRLSNHVHMQPVIHVSPDGQTAKIRSRMMQQLNLGGRASMGASIYENEAVKEDGVWKYKTVHTYNTWTAGYEGGWAKNPGKYLPGQSEKYPPDAPPTLIFEMYPTVYKIPFHYRNPASGK